MFIPQGANTLKRSFEDDPEEELITFQKIKPGKRELARRRSHIQTKPTRGKGGGEMNREVAVSIVVFAYSPFTGEDTNLPQQYHQTWQMARYQPPLTRGFSLI